MRTAADATLVWQKSTYCADGTCVEVAWEGDTVLMRDSKNLEQSYLRFDGDSWIEFTNGIMNGEFRSV